MPRALLPRRPSGAVSLGRPRRAESHVRRPARSLPRLSSTAVVTLTPAPVLDRTYVLDQLVHGKVNRASRVFEFMSGKGVNVARTMSLARRHVSAVLPIDRDDTIVAQHVEGSTVLHPVPITGRVRVNINIVEGGGTTTNLNQLGTPLSEEDWRRVVALTLQQLDELQAGWLLVSGTLPDVIDTGARVDLTELLIGARARGARVGVDTSGPELARWARSPHVDLIKPNADELATLVGRELLSIGDVLEAGHELIDAGLDYVLASLGADGAVAMSARDVLWGRAVPSRVVNTTGAGDAFIAGFLSAATPPGAQRDAVTGLLPVDVAAGLAVGVSWGAHAVTLPTTVLESLHDAPPPVVSPPDPSMRLSEPTLVG